MRAKSGKELESGGWIHETGAVIALADRVQLPVKVEQRPVIDWTAEAKKYQCSRHAEHYRHELAQTLGVSVAALESLWVGWGYDREPWWSFPERSPRGGIVGIVRRYKDGRKKMIQHGTHGLYYSAMWATTRGPVYIPEGGSDTAALITIGLPAIGRPSCRGGVGMLASMLGPRMNKLIIVVGEMDLNIERRGKVAVCPKNCGGCPVCWPGLFGARDTARALSARINRKVRWTMPPKGCKDVRDWLTKHPSATPADFAEAFKGRT